jgi:hypothetical protein
MLTLESQNKNVALQDLTLGFSLTVENKSVPFLLFFQKEPACRFLGGGK